MTVPVAKILLVQPDEPLAERWRRTLTRHLPVQVERRDQLPALPGSLADAELLIIDGRLRPPDISLGFWLVPYVSQVDVIVMESVPDPALALEPANQGIVLLAGPPSEEELGRAAAGLLERRRLRAELAECQARQALLGAAAQDGLWTWDATQDTLWVSPRTGALLGYACDELPANLAAALALVHPNDLKRVQERLETYQRQGSSRFEVEHRLRSKCGHYRWFRSRGLADRDPAGQPIRWAGSLTDITEQRLEAQGPNHDHFHDARTGLPNRHLLLNRLSRAMEVARDRGNHPFAILCVNCDHFGVINDGLGHPSGDQILLELARRLQTAIRPGDMLARTGGDEFAILVESIRGIEDAIRVANRIHAEMQLPFLLDGKEVFVSVGIGISTLISGLERAEEVLQSAATAMAQAKASGKGRSLLFDHAMHEEAVARLELESELHHAVLHDEFFLEFQPILSLVSGRIVGFEALIRWDHPRKGRILPDQFIPLAEETGLIAAIGRRVLEQACELASHWPAPSSRRAPVWVSVNLSPRELDEDMVRHVGRMLRRYRGPSTPFSLHLEITERLFLGPLDQTTALLEELSAMGVPLLVDDFGTGYSSLCYLRRMPIDYLKIDGSFIQEMVDGHGSTEIVRTIVQLGRNLGIEVIAERVETSEQLALLHKMRCKYAQGRFFSGPVDADTAHAMLADDFRWSFATPADPFDKKLSAH